MTSTDFITKKQLKESIALPKVGVKYVDGAGGVRSFGVFNASELGSLDAAFGAAAAGVRNSSRDRNLDLAKSLTEKDGKDSGMKAMKGSAVVIEGNEIGLVGEKDGDGKKKRRFFGTSEDGKKGWHEIDGMDRPRKGDLVGPTMNVRCEADHASRDMGEKSPWSFQVSRTSFRKNEDTGEIKLFNYFRTFYVSGMGRIIGASEEEEVLVGVMSNGGDGDCPCARPVYGAVNGSYPDENTPEEDKVIEYIDFATARQFAEIDSKGKAAKEASDYYNSIKGNSTPEGIRKANEAYAKSEQATADLEAAEAAVKRLKVGEFSVKTEFDANTGVLSKLLFGGAFDVQKNAEDETKVKNVETRVGCPYFEDNS